VLELEAGDLDAAGPRCADLGSLADRLGGGGSEVAFARAISALYALTRNEPGSATAFDDAVTGLERIDAGFLAPDLLGIAAEAEYRAGDAAQASVHAGRAFELARSTGRPMEACRARVLLACLAARDGAVDEAERHLQAVAGDEARLSAHIRALKEEVWR
jgi:hypothetical protein